MKKAKIITTIIFFVMLVALIVVAMTGSGSTEESDEYARLHSDIYYVDCSYEIEEMTTTTLGDWVSLKLDVYNAFDATSSMSQFDFLADVDISYVKNGVTYSEHHTDVKFPSYESIWNEDDRYEFSTYPTFSSIDDVVSVEVSNVVYYKVGYEGIQYTCKHASEEEIATWLQEYEALDESVNATIALVVAVGFFISLAVMIAVSIMDQRRGEAKKNAEFRENFERELSNSRQVQSDCDNSCIEEGDDIFATKREENTIEMRDARKSANKANSGKIYCRHCGVQMLYDSNKCEWCGKYQ